MIDNLTRLLLFLLFATCFATMCRAETWNIYVWQGCKTPKETAWSSPKYLRASDFEAAVKMADEALRKHADFGVRAVRNNRIAQVGVYTGNPNQYRDFYVGRGTHAAGFWMPEYSAIMINDGLVPRWTSGLRTDYHYAYVKNIRGLAALILHELGHHNSLLGRSHNLDLARLLHSKPPKAERDWLRRRFGSSIGGE